MRTSIKIAAFMAIAVGAADLALGQGPIREGLRRTGEAAANVTRGVVGGTADVARGVGEATVGTARVAADALTPATPFQAQAGANLSAIDNSRDARWRFSRHNNEWWYYNPQNQWMYHRDGQWQQFSQDNFQPLPQNQQLAQGQQFQGQEYSSGYRGMDQGQIVQDQGFQQQGISQQLRHDRFGRAYICENGRPVYVDEGQYQAQGQMIEGQPTSAMPEEHSVARQNLDQQQNLNQQTAPPQPAQPPQGDIQQGQSTIQSNQSIQSSAAPATASGSASTSGAADVRTAPAGPVSDTQAQGSTAAPREINNTPSPQTQGATDNPSR
jgi:hypothetical protein